MLDLDSMFARVSVAEVFANRLRDMLPHIHWDMTVNILLVVDQEVSTTAGLGTRRAARF